MSIDLSCVGQSSRVHEFTYDWKQTVLYALGIGAKRDELDYLYEGRGPKVLPSFVVAPKFPALREALAMTKGDRKMVVHGGERIVVHKPIPAEGTLKTTAKVRGIYDMRKFAICIVDTETKDAAGVLLAETMSSIIYRGYGGWGGETPPKERSGIKVPTDRAADFRIEETTSPEQALLYRLSGDENPLHADPELAASVGFPQGPILHGLCTFGYMVRHTSKGLFGGDAARLKAIEGQFKKPVWPGDTIVTEGWVTAPGEVALSVSVKERNEVVLSGAWAKFTD